MLRIDMIQAPLVATFRMMVLPAGARVGGYFYYDRGLWVPERIEAVAWDEVTPDTGNAYAVWQDPVVGMGDAWPADGEAWLEQLVVSGVGGVGLVDDDLHDDGLNMSSLTAPGRAFADLFRAYRDRMMPRWDQREVDLFRQNVEYYWTQPIMASDARVYYRVRNRSARPASVGLRVVGRCLALARGGDGGA